MKVITTNKTNLWIPGKFKERLKKWRLEILNLNCRTSRWQRLNTDEKCSKSIILTQSPLLNINLNLKSSQTSTKLKNVKIIQLQEPQTPVILKHLIDLRMKSLNIVKNKRNKKATEMQIKKLQTETKELKSKLLQKANQVNRARLGMLKKKQFTGAME